MDFTEHFEKNLMSFSKEIFEFMIAGGYAVNFHGYNRTTSDMDIWVRPIEENKHKIFSALITIGYSEQTLLQVLELDFIKPFSFSIGDKPFKIDVFNHITGVSYDNASTNKIEFKWNNTLQLSFISVHDLMVNKMLTGRSKDKLDVEELQKIRTLKKK